MKTLHMLIWGILFNNFETDCSGATLIPGESLIKNSSTTIVALCVTGRNNYS